MRHTHAMDLLSMARIDLCRVAGRVEVLGRNNAMRIVLQKDRRERAKVRLARIRSQRAPQFLRIARAMASVVL